MSYSSLGRSHGATRGIHKVAIDKGWVGFVVHLSPVNHANAFVSPLGPWWSRYVLTLQIRLVSIPRVHFTTRDSFPDQKTLLLLGKYYMQSFLTAGVAAWRGVLWSSRFNQIKNKCVPHFREGLTLTDTETRYVTHFGKNRWKMGRKCELRCVWCVK